MITTEMHVRSTSSYACVFPEEHIGQSTTIAKRTATEPYPKV